MRLIIESAGKVASRVRLGAHELTFDQPGSVSGGDDRGPSPLDVLVASVAACAHYYAAAFLSGRGLPTDRLTVEAESEKERTPVPRIARITLKVLVAEGLTEQQISGVTRAIKHCPAYNTLVTATRVDLVVGVATLAGDAPTAVVPEPPLRGGAAG